MVASFTHPFILMKQTGNIPSICYQSTAGFKRGTAPLGSINSTAQQEREKERKAGRQTCLPLQKNSRKSAGMGRTYLLKGSFAPVYRLCSDIAAISTLGWPGCCLSASCKVTGPASCLNPNSGHHSLLWNSIFNYGKMCCSRITI